MKFANVLTLCTLTAMATASNVAAGDVPSYMLVTLPDADGLTIGRSAINDAQQVTITKFAEATFPQVYVDNAYVWNVNDGLRRVFVPGGPATGRLFDINESGQIIGAWTGPAGTNLSVPFLWEDASGAASIFPGFFQAPELVRTLALNDLGQAVGTIAENFFTETFDRYGFYWDGVSDPEPIPQFLRATDVNNAGQIVGQSSGETLSALLRDTDGTFIDLGILPGDSQSIAHDINEHGVVVGASGEITGTAGSPPGLHEPAAFLWSDGTLIPLDPAGKFATSAAHSINDLGQVVGTATYPDGQNTGFLWEDGTLWSFDELVGSPLCAAALGCRGFDINNHGDIVGSNLSDDFVLIRNVTPLEGDYNADGKVDAADYVAWRKNDESPTGYATWRAHFGTSLGSGSGSALPSAESLSAAVPEPASAALICATALLLVVSPRRWRRGAILARGRSRCELLVLFATLALFAAALIAQAEICYEVTDLSEFVGGNRVARAINEAGQVVGGPGPGPLDSTGGYLWDPITGVRLLGSIPPYLVSSYATNLNDTGMVVGSLAGVAIFAPVQHAFVWEEETGIVDVGTLDPPTQWAQALAVNDAGLVVGRARGFIIVSPTEIVEPSQGFIWDNAGGFRALDDFQEANSVNNAGQIVGQSFDPTPDDDSSGPHAILLDPMAGLLDLGTLPGSSTSRAADINEHGQVVGSSGDHAFLWQDGMMTPLDTGGLSLAQATAINNEGKIVGHGSGPAALVWNDGTLHQLNDMIDLALGWHLEYASDINDRGQIVGWGTRDGFGTSLRAFLLTPIAEPEPDLRGDYNGDGTVDAADYVVWRKSVGQVGAGLPSDGDGNGSVDEDDYMIWRAQFGRTPTSGSIAARHGAVPEPNALIVALVGTTLICFMFRKSRSVAAAPTTP